MSLQDQIEHLASREAGEYSSGDFLLFNDFKTALNRGEIRAAERDPEGKWHTNAWVKRGILLGFRMGSIIELTSSSAPLQFLDKNTYPIRKFSTQDRVRIVPGGSSIRDGAYVAPGVVCMPPMFVNAGAYVDEGTMIDSHALVGSCAQIGKRGSDEFPTLSCAGGFVCANRKTRASFRSRANRRRPGTSRRDAGDHRGRCDRRRQLRRL